MKTKALALDERNPPSRLTVALHEAGLDLERGLELDIPENRNQIQAVAVGRRRVNLIESETT